MKFSRPIAVVFALVAVVVFGDQIRDRRGLRLRAPVLTSSAADPLTLLYERNFTLSSAALPPCVGDSTCAALCYSTGTAWACIDNTGSPLGSVTQGTGATHSRLPWSDSLYAQDGITDTSAPTADITALNSFFASDHTVVVGGYGKDLNAADFQYYLEQFGAQGGLHIRQESGVLACLWCGDAFGTCTNRQASPGGPVVPKDGWFTSSCRRSGNTYTARVMGNDSSPATVSIGTFGSDLKTAWFGRRSAGSYPLQGPLAFVAWYSSAKTSAELDAIDGRFWGSGPMVGGIPSLRFIDFDGGVTAAYQTASKPLTSAGLSTPRAVTNVWGPQALHADGTAAVGTPTITPDAGPGPFDSWYARGQTCASVLDDSAVAFEGSESATAGTADGLYTVSAYLATGDAGTTTTKARLSVVATGGTGSRDCDITVTATPTRYRCTSSVAGASAIKGRILVGNAASDTGSIQVCHSQFEHNGYPSAPLVNNTAVGDTALYLPADELAAWPAGATRGAIEVIFTPGFNFGRPNTWDGGTSIWATGSEVYDNTDTFYLFDTVSSAPDHQLIMWWPGSTTTAKARLQAADGGINEVESAVFGLSKGAQYVERMAWTTSGGLCSLSLYLDTCSDASTCHASTLIAGPSALGSCPTGDFSKAFMMDRYTSSFPTEGFLKSVRAYGDPQPYSFCATALRPSKRSGTWGCLNGDGTAPPGDRLGPWVSYGSPSSTTGTTCPSPSFKTLHTATPAERFESTVAVTSAPSAFSWCALYQATSTLKAGFFWGSYPCCGDYSVTVEESVTLRQYFSPSSVNSLVTVGTEKTLVCGSYSGGTQALYVRNTNNNSYQTGSATLATGAGHKITFGADSDSSSARVDGKFFGGFYTETALTQADFDAIYAAVTGSGCQ